MIHLLVVDDEQASRSVIKAFLSRAELPIGRISEACDGQEAIAVLRSGDVPDIVITDMEMPVVNGIRFLEYLKDCYPEIKILVVSGYFDFQYTHAAITAGAEDYILKPIDAKKLCDAMERCIKSLQQRGTVRFDGDSSMDIDTYKQLQRSVEQMRCLLEAGQFSAAEAELRRIGGRLSVPAMSEAAETFAAQLLIHTLHYHCLSQDYPCFNVEDRALQLISKPKMSDVMRLYDKVMQQIQREQPLQNIDVILEKIKNYIDASFRLPLRQESIAASFYLNREYMGIMFRRKYGITMGNYITRLKMEEGKRLLADQTIPIAGVAQMIGYDDPAYFNRVFKKYTGDSPGKYRAKTTENSGGY